eukprot:438587_1
MSSAAPQTVKRGRARGRGRSSIGHNTSLPNLHNSRSNHTSQNSNYIINTLRRGRGRGRDRTQITTNNASTSSNIRGCDIGRNRGRAKKSVIKDLSPAKCTGKTIKCLGLSRVVNALKYYQSLPLAANDSKRNDTFIEFCMSEYTACLNDYIHLICVHSGQIHDIITINGLQCQYSNINQCKWTRRHFGDRNSKFDDKHYNFYVDLFNTMHFYLFHLEATGLRTNQQNQNDTNYLTGTTDVYFRSIQKEIALKRKQFSDIINIVKSKFNISIAKSNLHKQVISKENTTTDNMFIYIQNKLEENNDVFSTETTLNELYEYIENEEFDTDAIFYDIDNILIGIKNNIKCIQCIQTFINNHNISSKMFDTTFSTGI